MIAKEVISARIRNCVIESALLLWKYSSRSRAKSIHHERRREEEKKSSAYLFVRKAQFVLQNGLAVNQRLNFIRERDEGIGQSLNAVDRVHVTRRRERFRNLSAEVPGIGPAEGMEGLL